MLEGLMSILNVQCLLLLVAGATVGAIFGCIPGLTGGIAIAIFVPFTYYLDLAPAMALLVGIYAGGAYGGSITAILISTPGAPEAGMTVFDGAPMAKKGLSGKALKTALYSSSSGNLLGAIITMCLIFVIAKFALMIGPAEYFGLLVFSIVLIATIGSKGNWIKGLLATAFGLFISFIGCDPITGAGRFTFGNAKLMSGIELVPLMIGMFVGAEVLGSIGIKREHKKISVDFKNDNRITKGDIKKCLPAIFSGSIIGSVIGALPGLNAAISATLNYAFAKKISKNPDEFGKGAIDGIAAAEAANNATAGPTLAPLLTLGIPGSGNAAIFLGALLLKGVQVGPNIMREHSDVVYAILFSLVIATLALLFVGSLLIRVAQYVVFVPPDILNPIVIFTCCAGIYASNKSIFDIGVFLVFMVVGFFFSTLQIPLLPMLISFLLGDMMEANFRRALIISKTEEGGMFSAIFSSKIAMGFLIIAGGLLVYSLVSDILKQRKQVQKGS